MESYEDDEDSILCTPEISETGDPAISTSLPQISKKIYDKTYRSFMDWRVEKNTNSFSENVLLEYFAELAVKYKSSSLWSFYSMLKAVLRINHDVDLEKFGELRSFLKQQSEGYEAKKSRTLNPEEIKKFITQAPDEMYLLHKVVLIVGMMGACRSNELQGLKIEDIKDLNTAYLITISKTKTNVVRKFIITDHYYNIVKKFIDLRPAHVATSSFFLNYKKTKCTTQRIGKNKFAEMGKEIAMYLKLPNPELYTGRCYWKSSTYIDGNSDGDTTDVKCHEGLKSMLVTDQSFKNGMTTADTTTKQANNAVASVASTSTSTVFNRENINITFENNTTLHNLPSIQFINCKNINIHFVTK